jgi:phosphatidylserine/phosphatidylglycerophosphate/cardiolipin synthase-like enzyme
MLQIKKLISVSLALVLLLAAGSAHSYKVPEIRTKSLIVMPDDGIKAILAIVQSAGRSIDIVMHRLEDQRVRDALKVAMKRGVMVRVMLEDYPKDIGETRKEAERKIKEAGAFVQWANPEFKLTHQKTIIIDSLAAYISTFDFTKEAIDRSRGFVVKTTDPREVGEIARMFEADWTRKRFAHKRSKLAWSPEIYRTKAFRTVHDARHTLHIYTEAIGNAHMVSTIARAVNRGLMVRVLVSAEAAAASNPDMIKLMQAGAIVRVQKEPRLRANVILPDAGRKNQEALVGSVALTSAAMDEGRGLAITLRDAKRLSRIEAAFKSDYDRAK